MIELLEHIFVDIPGIAAKVIGKFVIELLEDNFVDIEMLGKIVVAGMVGKLEIVELVVALEERKLEVVGRSVEVAMAWQI